MKISLIIPLYNSSCFLKHIFNSIFIQSFKNFEIIFVDDGSVDGSSDLVKKFIDEYNGEAKLISISNSGSNPARMIGVKNAKYDYVVFADSDDTFDEKYLLTFVEQYEKGLDIISNSTYVKGNNIIHKTDVANDAPVIIEAENNGILKRLYSYKGICDYFWNKLFKKDLFVGIDMSNRLPFEELRTMHRIFEKAKKIKIIDEPHYYYIHRNNSQSSRKPLINYYKYEARKERYFYTINNYKDNDLENMISYRLVDDFVDLVQDEKRSVWKKDYSFIKKIYKDHKKYIDNDLRLKRHINLILIVPFLYKSLYIIKNLYE